MEVKEEYDELEDNIEIRNEGPFKTENSKEFTHKGEMNSGEDSCPKLEPEKKSLAEKADDESGFFCIGVITISVPSSSPNEKAATVPTKEETSQNRNAASSDVKPGHLEDVVQKESTTNEKDGKHYPKSYTSEEKEPSARASKVYCDVCFRVFNCKAKLNRHIQLKHSLDKSTLQLKHSEQSEVMVEPQDQHSHPSFSDTVPDQNISNTIKTNPLDAPRKNARKACPLCGEDFVISKIGYYSHLAKHCKDKAAEMIENGSNICVICHQHVGTRAITRHLVAHAKEMFKNRCTSMSSYSKFHKTFPWPRTVSGHHHNKAKKRFEYKHNSASKRSLNTGQSLHLQRNKTHNCSECSEVFRSRTSLDQHFANTHQVKNISTSSTSSKEGVPHLSPSHTSASGSNQVLCHFCKKVFSKAYILRHLKAIHNAYMCLPCGLSFPSKQRFRKHQHSVHKLKVRKESTALKTDSKEKTYEEEEIVSKGKKVPCSVCSKGITPGNLGRHMRDAHGETGSLCLVCGMGFSSRENLRRHKVIKHGIVKNVIKKKVENPSLKKHVASASHTETEKTILNNTKSWEQNGEPHEESRVCPFCQMSFPKLKGLQRHISEKHNEGDKCTQCGQMFTNKLSLERHINVMHGRLRGKSKETLRSSPRLEEEETNQKKVGDGEDRFCPYCSMKCLSIRFLQIHLSKKHDDRGTCGLCGNKHSSSEALRRHFLLDHKSKVNLPHHVIDKLFPCHICNKSFQTHQNALRHLREVHDENNMCTQCGKTFVTNEGTRIHMLLEHHLGSLAADIENKLHQPCIEKASDKNSNLWQKKEKTTGRSLKRRRTATLEIETAGADDSDSSQEYMPDKEDSDSSWSEDEQLRIRAKLQKRLTKQKKGKPAQVNLRKEKTPTHALKDPKAIVPEKNLGSKTVVARHESASPPKDCEKAAVGPNQSEGQTRSIAKTPEKSRAVQKVPNKNKYTCKFCNEAFDIHDKNLLDHLKVHFKDMGSEMLKKGKLTCSECKAALKEGPALFEHMETHAEQICKILRTRITPKHKCSDCGQMFPSLKELTEHFTNVHAKKGD